MQKKVVIIGAGPCGLVALKEMRERGHDAIALDKAAGIGGLFCKSHEARGSYENLYLTISNMFMAFSDFPPEDLRVKYSSKEEYGSYLEAYADHFALRPHVRLGTTVKRAALEGGRWRIHVEDRRTGAASTLEADALIVATGSNHTPRTFEASGFTGEVVHSADYKNPRDYAGKHVLVVGSGESAFDVAADLAGVAQKTTVWSRSPISAGPRFIMDIWRDPRHDELATMKDEALWSKAKISDLLESMTMSRAANAAPIWAYTTIRHLIFASLRLATPQSKVLSALNRMVTSMDMLLGDQHTIPTKSARLCGVAAQGKARVIIAHQASFSGKRASFSEVLFEGSEPTTNDAPREAVADDIDVIVACTGYKTDLSWIDVPGLDWSPRTWFKHCFPKGYGDKLMFLGWARPHQGGIPPCAEMLARYIAMILDGSRALPADYEERAAREGADEHAYYKNAQGQVNVVDYPAFMDSVARLVGCLPEPPKPTEPERLIQYWLYPNWPLWYRQSGPGARPELVNRVLDAFPLKTSFDPNPFNVMALAFSLAQAPVSAVLPARSGLDRGWVFKAKKHILHGNA